MRPSDPISTVESWVLRVISPIVGLGFAGWMIATRSLSAEGVTLVLGLGVARPLAGMLRGDPPGPPSTPDSQPSGGSS